MSKKFIVRILRRHSFVMYLHVVLNNAAITAKSIIFQKKYKKVAKCFVRQMCGILAFNDNEKLI